MPRHSTSSHMSQITDGDVTLITPISPSNAPWDQCPPSYSGSAMNNIGWSYYPLPPSPPISIGSNTSDSPGPSSKIFGTRTSPDSVREKEQQLCLPTHQVFDFPEPSPSISPPPSKPSQPSISIDTEVPAEGLSSLPIAGPSKRPRTGGERITTKDFVPPDVSGLSKREARLVKNRAAAFLSRQRKREEFEAMEIRVKELEEDNARLQAASKRGHDGLLSEIEQLRARLSASEKRGRELKAELSRRSDVHVKTENYDHCLTPVSPSASLPTPSHQRSGASLGLMVLLCTLPSLLSLSPRSLPTTYFIPPSDPSVLQPSCNFDYSSIIPSEIEWAPHPDGGAMMNLGFGDLAKLSSSTGSSSPHKLEIHSEAIRALGGFEISFDASPVNTGKIQVRIHPSQSHNINSNQDAQRARPSSVPMWFESAPNNYGSGFSAALSFTSSSAPASSFVPLTSDFDLDPFLSGVHDSGMPYGSCGPAFGQHPSDATFEHIPGFMSGTRNDFSKHRGRVTMRNMSAIGMEGEWEVPTC
ncbi:uncharacterized protein EDB91DRAFT_1248883 [Suillus paluster]|uniref:uncharacterized protein n=1 Tax=Suillus paluster TaxID=48578 RepID=UPI001B86973C|nr:uncharacterized protein EDB91DRAFT_1248883 [Suillus paluster]KAG1739123.1 hypothetical protein EDB91DRAFT_1248883 [Suillus paluster]